MNTCDTCGNWTKKNDMLPKREQRKYFDGIMLCGHFSISSESPSDDGISVDGYIEDFCYSPMTGPKFGCIHWERKE